MQEGCDEGSSPRMRGARLLCCFRTWPPGIIPADAGSTCAGGSGAFGAGDHPRGCGEHMVIVRPSRVGMGSSPRMRGALRLAVGQGFAGGIIPADAGSTVIVLAFALLYEDHPRGCGEHSGVCPAGPCSGGIIPADAGSTRYRRGLAYRSVDHPRGCGEHALT